MGAAAWRKVESLGGWDRYGRQVVAALPRGGRSEMSRARLGIVVTHPIQYQVPLFRYLGARSTVETLRVPSEHGLAESFDLDSGKLVKYDVPLLGGYGHRIDPQLQSEPLVSLPWGVFNPSSRDLSDAHMLTPCWCTATAISLIGSLIPRRIPP